MYIKNKLLRKTVAFSFAFPIWITMIYLLGSFARISIEAMGIAGCIPALAIAFYIDSIVGREAGKIHKKKWAAKKKEIYRRILISNGVNTHE